MSGAGDDQTQLDLFSQALFMLDEVNDEEPPLTNEDMITPETPTSSQTPITSLEVKNESTPATTSQNNVTAAKTQVLPATIQTFTRTADGRIVMTSVLPAGKLANPNMKSIIAQSNVRGIVRNGSAPSLTSNDFISTVNPSLPHALSSKDVSRIWSSDAISVKRLSPVFGGPSGTKAPDEEEEAEEEEEELGVAETYADYMPSKLKLGIRHPDPVVETSSLSSVEPPDVWYDLSIPEPVIDSGALSALQLEAVTYACQRHETMLPSGERAGYLIGDGAGVGKGRTLAGIIYENYLAGRKRSLWFSVSTDLKIDAERDLGDIGASKISVYALNKFKYAKISSAENGSVKKGVIFSTYSSLIGESSSNSRYRTRMKMLLNWCGADFDGVIVFDECHKAKNLVPAGSSKPTKTGLCVLELQRMLPKARVVYASATGASEPKNMAYMTRIGLWGPGTPFTEFNDFIQAVEKRGVGAMELVAMDMKLRGMYIARQLSFHGVSFHIEDLPVPKESVRIYNASVKLWVDARSKFAEAAELIDAERSMAKSMWGQFWSAHQRFFKYLCISSKVRHAVKIAKEALRHGKCVVIGLQSTGEARTLEQLEEMGGELNDFVSTAKGVLQSLIDKHFPAPDSKKAFDIFGLQDKKNSIFDDFDIANILGREKLQRQASLKVSGSRKTRSGRGSIYKEVSDESDKEESDGSEFEPDSNDGSGDDESGGSDSNSDQSDEEADDFNPFGGSDSDEDPWIKRSKGKTNGSTKRKKKDNKTAGPAKKAKHTTQKQTNGGTKHKTKQDSSNESDAASDIDDIMDSVLGKMAARSQELKQSQPAAQMALANADKSGASGSSTPITKPQISPEEAKEKASALKKQLLDRLDELGDTLPANTLDELIDSFGGTDNVAEMTGRKGRVVSDENGVINYELRSAQDVPLEILNLTEKQRFMDGEKLVAIISEAASSGISLQADRRVANQRRRLHITLELPWSADRAIQQFGRTHRSNQVNAPEYVFLISELAGERRFASTVAKRLECLGALTHGDRRATESRDLSQFNIDNKYGRTALEIIMKSIVNQERPLVPPPSSYKGNFMEDIKESLVGVGLISMDNRYNIPMLEKDYNVMNKFLNRILGVPVEQQNALFQYFTDTLAAVILQAKRNGHWDLGILDLGTGGENVKVLSKRLFEHEYSGSVAKTELLTISVERGLSWEDAMNIWQDHLGSDDGFYVSSNVRQGKDLAVLAVAISGGKKKDKLYQVYRPNTGLSPKMESLSDLKKKYKKVTPDHAEEIWLDQYEQSAEQCVHMYWRDHCKKRSVGLTCEIGLRTRTYHVLTGSVLSVWNKVEMVLASVPRSANQKMQIIRLKTDAGKRIIGTLIPGSVVSTLTTILSQRDEAVKANTPSTSSAMS